MLGQPFTHDMIRKYVVAFGTLFNNVKLMRVGEEETQWISVPLTYGPKEKWFNRLTDPNLTNQIQIALPRMSYELTTVSYDPDRKMNTLNKISGVPVGDTVSTMFEAVPYDLQFTLSMYARNAADATNILEQIVPFFTPEFTVTIKDATSLNVAVDAPIVLNSISREDGYEGDFESKRTIIWTLDFTMKGKLFGPIQNSKPIKKAYVDFFIPGSTVAHHVGTVAEQAVATNKIFLQANTASRANNVYNGGVISIIDPTPSLDLENVAIVIPDNVIINYDGAAQLATLRDNLPELADTNWTYSIEYLLPRGTNGLVDTSIPTAVRVYTEPGLTVDGDPTNNPDSQDDLTTIDADDDYGFIQTQTFFPSHPVKYGSRRNLKTGVDE